MNSEPTARVRRLLIAVAALYGLLYWLLAVFHGEAFDVALIYRFGDIQYLPLIKAFSHLQFGEHVILERLGEGVTPFPLGSILPHGIASALMGPYGYVAVDVAAHVAYFLLLVALFGRLRMPSPLKEVAAIIILAGAARVFVVALRAAGIPFEIEAWSYRIPRPFISELYLLGCVYAMMVIASAKAGGTKARLWAVLGVCYALLLQGDVYGAFAIAPVIAGLVLLKLLHRDASITSTLRGPLTAAVAVGICAAPFVYQRLAGPPDLPGRFGIFDLPRSRLLFLTSPHALVLLALVLIAAGSLAAALRKSTTAEDRKALRPLLVAPALAVSGFLALPLFILLAGKGVQLYHFETSFEQLGYYALVFAGAKWVEIGLRRIARTRLCESIRRLKSRASWRIGALAALVLLVMGMGYSRFEARYARGHHMRFDFSEFDYGERYREQFRDLTDTLAALDTGKYKVLGTFDIQAYSWWLAFGGGNAFVPDCFDTVQTDAQTSQRLAGLAKYLGLGEAAYREFVQSPGPNVFWLGANKYHVNRIHTHAPLEEYTEDQRRRIAQTDELESWEIMMTPAEVDDQAAFYADAVTDIAQMPRLDVVVLGSRKPDHDLAPPASEFDLHAQNDIYRIYLRRQTQRTEPR